MIQAGKLFEFKLIFWQILLHLNCAHPLFESTGIYSGLVLQSDSIERSLYSDLQQVGEASRHFLHYHVSKLFSYLRKHATEVHHEFSNTWPNDSDWIQTSRWFLALFLDIFIPSSITLIEVLFHLFLNWNILIHFLSSSYLQCLP